MEGLLLMDPGEISIKELQVGNYTLHGQSVAGIRSCIAIPELDVVFDAGVITSKSVNCRNVLVTHGHADHCGCLHMHALERSTRKYTTPNYWMPVECRDAFDRSYRSQKFLNRGVDSVQPNTYQPTLNYLQITDQLTIKHTLIARAYQTIHSVPSQGYVIFDVVKKLKPEYNGRPGKEIAEMRKKGVEVTNTVEKPIIAYTGDTKIDGVIQHPQFLNAEILIMECSYIVSDRVENIDTLSEATSRYHIHEQHIIDNADKFQNKHIVLTHLSKRYTLDMIEKAIQRIQEAFGSRIQIHYF